MLSKKAYKFYFLGICIIIIMVVIYLSGDYTKELYGNDKESIVNGIGSMDQYENKEIEILDVKEVYGRRVAAFLFDSNPAYIEFEKNEKGNYVQTKTASWKGKTFTSFLIQEFKDDNEIHASQFLMITNEHNEIAKLELTVNKQRIEQDFEVNQKSVVWIELPEADQYRFQYQYYDKNGLLIEDH